MRRMWHPPPCQPPALSVEKVWRTKETQNSSKGTNLWGAAFWVLEVLQRPHVAKLEPLQQLDLGAGLAQLLLQVFSSLTWLLGSCLEVSQLGLESQRSSVKYESHSAVWRERTTWRGRCCSSQHQHQSPVCGASGAAASHTHFFVGFSTLMKHLRKSRVLMWADTKSDEARDSFPVKIKKYSGAVLLKIEYGFDLGSGDI